jgi:glycosyltransferase involved in cell wall biosynthesis
VKTAFIAMSNHLKITKSSDFFIALLREFFGDVTVISHERAWTDIPKSKWDLIVVWQKRYSPRQLEALGADRVVLIPMYDDVPLDEAYWAKYRGFKVFCFSSTLERLLLSYGVPAWGARYYPEPKRAEHDWSGLRGFFWPRVRSIDWRLVKTLIGETKFSRMHLHWTPAIDATLRPELDEEERSSGRVQVSTWFKNSDEFLELVAQSNVFFAPRRTEGIGMSFLEAMAMGHCTVASNMPTMSEYIEDGVNGLLFDPDRPAPLDFSRARELGEAARASCEAGRARWLGDLPQLRAFLEEPLPVRRSRARPFVVAQGRAVYAMRSVPGARNLYHFMRRLLKCR